MRSILLILMVAGIWAGTGVIVGIGLSAYFGVHWIVECGSLNLAIGMIFLQLVTRSEVGRKLFYDRVREEDQLHLGIAFLWAIPVAMALAGMLWWLIGKLFPPLP
jgi:hypothetical protein